MKRMVLMAVLAMVWGTAVAEEPKVGESISSQIEPWTVAPIEYVCTPDQRTNMEAESKFCMGNTTYSKDYCYGTAFIRNCTKRPQARPPQG
ncbi:hypothetical protein [Novimethylophilus kurashikiensis]|nr:hypothetical protein [Novimethylophilus kurashikiensis]